MAGDPVCVAPDWNLVREDHSQISFGKSSILHHLMNLFKASEKYVSCSLQKFAYNHCDILRNI